MLAGEQEFIQAKMLKLTTKFNKTAAITKVNKIFFISFSCLSIVIITEDRQFVNKKMRFSLKNFLDSPGRKNEGVNPHKMESICDSMF